MALDLPEKIDLSDLPDRQYRTALPGKDFLKLTEMSAERGITPYQYTRSVMIAYLNGQLTEVPQVSDFKNAGGES